MESPTLGCARNISTATLSAWRDADLPADQMQTLAAHTPTCAACQARLADYDAIARALVGQRELDPADRVMAGVRARARRGPRLSRGQVWGGVGALGAAAALLLLFVYVFGPTLGNRVPRLNTAIIHLPDASYQILDAVAGRSGDVWFSEAQVIQNPNGGSGYSQGRAKIGHLSASGQITEYPLPPTDNFDTPPYSGALTVAPDGTIWFVKLVGGLVHTALPQTSIVKMAPDGTMAGYPLPFARSNFFAPSMTTQLVAGPDGNLWFGVTIATHLGQDPGSTITTTRLARITPTGDIADFTIPAASGSFAIGDLIAGPDGNIWFDFAPFDGSVTRTSEVIARATPTGVITTFSPPSAATTVLNLVAGPDGNLWFLDSSLNNASTPRKVARLTPTGQITEFPMPASDSSWNTGLIAGGDHYLYFSQAISTCPSSSSCARFQGAIGRVSPEGQITITQLPKRANVIPAGLFATPGGDLYFAELTVISPNPNNRPPVGTDRIGRVTPSGQLTEYAVPTHGDGTFWFVPGPPGTLWLAESPPYGAPGTSVIVHITPPGS